MIAHSIFVSVNFLGNLHKDLGHLGDCFVCALVHLLNCGLKSQVLLLDGRVHFLDCFSLTPFHLIKPLCEVVPVQDLLHISGSGIRWIGAGLMDEVLLTVRLVGRVVHVILEDHAGV